MKISKLISITVLLIMVSACASSTEVSPIEEAPASSTESSEANTNSNLPKILAPEDAEAAWEILKNKPRKNFLWDFANEKYSEVRVPRTNTYTIELSKSETIIWAFLWCAKGETALDQNYSQIDVKFTIEDVEVPEDQLAVYSTTRYQCRMIYTALADWKAGEYHLSTTATFKSDINDGTSTFAAGDYIDVYTVYIKP